MPRPRQKDEGQKLWEASNAQVQRSVNKWAARVIPLILTGAVGYAVWALVVVLAINYLIKSHRTGAGIAIIVIFFVLMIPMALCYLRVLQIIATNPGFVPRPGESKKEQRQTDREAERRGERLEESSSEDKEDYINNHSNLTPSQQVGYLDRGSVGSGRLGPPPGLEKYYNRDIFECEMDGLPRWCSTCKIWKPDRTHHSSEVGKCVYKMDHFCPWAGGIISETSFKFFIQFCCYGAAFNLFSLVVAAYYTWEKHHQEGHYDARWIVVIGLSGLFFAFSFSMAYNSLFAVFINSTTVDNLNRRTKTYHFAVLIPESYWQIQAPQSALHLQNSARYPAHPAAMPPSAPPPLPFRTVTYPFPPAGVAEYHANQPTRTFAILATPQGSSPYRLPTTFQNFRTVFGSNPIDWFLPLRYSPCWDNGHVHGGLNGDHEKGQSLRGGSMYKMGPVVDDMIAAAGLPARASRHD